jgi:hypothetical protein
MASTSTVENTTRLPPSGWVLLSCSRSSTFCDELLAACCFQLQEKSVLENYNNQLLQICKLFKYPKINETKIKDKIMNMSSIYDLQRFPPK